MANGNVSVTFKYIATTLGIIGLLLTLGKLVWSASGQASSLETTVNRVSTIEPKVEAAIKHQIEGELNYLYTIDRLDDMDERFDSVESKMDAQQTQIIEAIQSIKKSP